MAAVESDIVRYMLNRTVITDVVGQRIQPFKLFPDTELPAITYTRVSATKDGRSKDSVLNQPIVQFSLWGEDEKELKDLADTLFTELDGLSMELGEKGQVTIFHENDRDLYDPASGLFHIPTEFQISYGFSKKVG